MFDVLKTVWGLIMDLLTRCSKMNVVVTKLVGSLILFSVYFLLSGFSFGQTLIINEVSQGETGGMEYVEFVVVDSTVNYNCASATPPCIDIRGWIIDDNSGYHGSSGIASGACRFSYDPTWSCVPLGTVIVVYNDADPNNQLPSDDLSLNDGNCAIVAPISSTALFETNSTTPGAVACSYPGTGWTAGGDWNNTVMANGGDCFRIVDLSGCEVFSVCWDNNNQNNMVYFPGGATSSSSATNTVYYFNDGDPSNSSNWTIGCADQPNCGQQDQTPGTPNNSLNANYIAQFNNGCSPITPINVVVNVNQQASCVCDGEVTAVASGSIGGYTYDWYDNAFNSIGQSSSTASGLCSGTYHVIATSSIDCSDTATVTINSSGGGITGIDPPLNDTVMCSANLPPSITSFSVFLTNGGALNGNMANVDTTSFNMSTQVSDGSTCPETITRNYEITDSCGLTFSAVHTIVIGDTVNPQANIPNSSTYQCISNVPAADINDVTGVSDNCTTNPTVTHVGDVSDGNTCPEEITRTYRVEDDCGNFIEVDQIITVNDDTAPTASNPATTTVQCASDVPATDPTVVTDEADNCTANPTVTFLSETSDNNVCDGEELTRVYEIADDCGNTTTVTHTIIIDAYTPTFTLAGTNPTSCQAMDGSIAINGLNPNTDYQINYNSGSTFIFNTDINGDYVISGLGAGVYTNFIISSTICLSCASSDNTVIELVGPNSPAVNAGEDVEICEGEDLTLTAQNPDGANISWDQGVSDGVSFTPNVSTEIYTVTANLGGCISTDDIEVIIHPLPSLDAGTDVSICEGESVTLSASGANNYSWDNGVADDVSFSPNTTTIYTVTGTSQEGCTTSDEVEVTVHSNPDVNIQADKTDGCLPLKVQFENNSSNADECVYTISDGTELTDCAATHTFYEPGCYDIDFKVTNTNGCTNSVAIEDYICVENLPQADFSFNPKELTTLKPTANFYNQSTDAIHYEWIFNNNTTSTNEDPVHTFLAIEDTYQVTLLAFGENGCADSITREVPLIEELLFYIPNTFTPDGNALNQTFKPVFTSGFDPYEYELLIFNRWGEIVFESNNSEAGWDGTYGVSSNKIVKSGTYVWKIFFKTKYDDEQKTEIGHVNLLK